MSQAQTLTAGGLRSAPYIWPNLIPNSGFEVFQAGTAAITAGNAAHVYSADHWTGIRAGACSFDMSQSADVPTVAEAGCRIPFSILCDVGTLDSAIVSTDYALLNCRIEAWRWAWFAQRDLVVDFWVKATKVGTYGFSITNNGADRSFIMDFTVNASATWEKKSFTVPASPTAGTWSYTTGVGVQVRWALAAGSDKQGTNNAWQTGNLTSTSNQVNGVDSTSNDFRIAAPYVRPVGYDAPWVAPLFPDELMYARRFFQKSFPYATAPAANTASIIGAASYRPQVAGTSGPNGAWVQFNPPMQTAPTMTYYNPNTGTATLWWNSTTTAQVSGASSSVALGETGVFIGNAQVANDAVGDDVHIHWAANARL